MLMLGDPARHEALQSALMAKAPGSVTAVCGGALTRQGAQCSLRPMQILLHSDPNTDGSHLMADHLQAVVKAAIGRFGERVTRVEAHLSDVNGQAKSGDDDIHCTLEASLKGLDAVVVKDHAGNAHQAIEGALRKLKRAVGAEIAKHDPRGHRTRPVVPTAEGSGDDAA